MGKVFRLEGETEEQRGVWIPAEGSDVYLGDRIRVRELYDTGLKVR